MPGYFQRPVFIGCFHKTGTVLWHGVIGQISHALDLVIWHLPGPADPPELRTGWDIAFDDHTTFFERDGIYDPDSRAVVSIRDPRDVVISGARYHLRSDEEWLDRPQDIWEGQSYRQMLQQCGSEHERFLFEMDYMGARTIEAMLGVDFNAPSVRAARLETLMQDREFEEFESIFRFLGFKDEHIPLCLDIARQNSLFAGQSHIEGHAAHGRTELWREVFDADLHEEFRNRFGNAAERLGYPAA